MLNKYKRPKRKRSDFQIQREWRYILDSNLNNVRTLIQLEEKLTKELYYFDHYDIEIANIKAEMAPLHLQIGEWDEAIQTMEEAVHAFQYILEADDPELIWHELMLVLIYDKLGQHSAAVYLLSTILDTLNAHNNPDFPDWEKMKRLLAQILLEGDDSFSALEMFIELLEFRKKDTATISPAHIDLARALRKNGICSEAIQLLNDALQLHYNNPTGTENANLVAEAHWEQALNYAELGCSKAALEESELARPIFQGNHNENTTRELAFLEFQMEHHFETGKWKKAIHWAKAAYQASCTCYGFTHPNTTELWDLLQSWKLDEVE
jgi:tetratricopeptide (TPR) repeat protein